MKDKVTIAVDRALLHKIDCLAEKQGRSRSNFIEVSMRKICEEITSHGVSARTDKSGS